MTVIIKSKRESFTLKPGDLILMQPGAIMLLTQRNRRNGLPVISKTEFKEFLLMEGVREVQSINLVACRLYQYK